MKNTDWLIIAQRLQALAQAGLTYGQNVYDLERYQELRDMSVEIIGKLSDEPVEKIKNLFANETGYQTPKVDVRAVLFRGTDEILMVQEKIDGDRWTLPGGWADVGYTPFETAVKEAAEETGLQTEAVRLLALFDKKKHAAHPPQPWYVYKCFVLCREVGGSLLMSTSETSGVRWVRESEISTLALSLDRTTPDQLATMFAFARQPDLPTLCD
ncbi:NUDIX hydrolase [Hymenobacter crusticola]|uniref:NUDIX hydrolase n=1 Tax=Hymenobacter crusticola TaxID=1770526 RepID=A0A243W7F4_9BACT|nr:NUDIX hydrolase N-terminal domain-containing protein [Hymenobacter crusticola]OUJ70871.1 NUDIX hydrolase [Hymenobacter crusticola]